MDLDEQFGRLADEEQLTRTVASLEKNGIKAIVVETGKEAKDTVLAMIEKGASVMTVTSTTSDQIGLSEAIETSEDFVSLRKKIMALPQSEQRAQARRINSAPDYAIGSIHALTENGQAVIVSNSGSQLPAYAASAAKVIWVVGTQKIVTNLDEAMARIEKYALKLESERMQKIYGMDSNIRKILIINSEIVPERITLILIKERLGF